ncbi:NAD(P)-dependent oxidoreductase [Rhodohalobacter barkolensis]|uniref:D-3-phosphoglycerate dehydrogenase n=1 Tax=Rhodohalobacter barkolensis TaxID=2053187 RepID=A0A2N0VEX0_9BACT|nr:NAD(P)-dependent oxidoreductase [Rhodohalobacter barkolensis]PKD42739.1 phosphoglycerate dehydrogenase [Rhodohalobacter barkolensis]
MKVTIADKLPEEAIDQLKQLGLDVDNNPGLKEKDLASGLKDSQILIVRSTVVNKECIDHSPKLSLIIRAGAGVNNIDIEAASGKGIYVANCPGKNAIAVAELTLGLILSLDRFIPQNVSDFNAGKWNKAAYSKADGLYGKTIGIIGTGMIGQEVIKRAQGFGLNVIAWSRSLTSEMADEMEIERAGSIQEVAEASDILSVHLAMNAQTKGIISKEILSSLKDGAMFINTSRDGVVDEEALYDEVKNGRLKAGLDVFSDEPEFKEGEFESRFQGLDNVCITHHIGASTNQAQMAVADDAVDIVRGYIKEGKVRNWLNRCEHTESPWQLVVRHYDKPGVIANVMNELKEANINAQELENVIFDRKLAACCTIQLDAEPSEKVLNNICTRQDEVISATLVPRS